MKENIICLGTVSLEFLDFQVGHMNKFHFTNTLSTLNKKNMTIKNSFGDHKVAKIKFLKNMQNLGIEP